MIHQISLMIYPVWVIFGSKLRQEILPVKFFLFLVISVDLAFDILGTFVSALQNCLSHEEGLN